MKIRNKELDIEKVDKALQQAHAAIKESTISGEVDGKNLSFWPLFLSEGERAHLPPEIHTCATSFGIMALSELSIDKMGEETPKILQSVCRTLMWMRNNDGSWPSMVSSTNQPMILEGVINDTVYALNALLKLGFLTHSPEISLTKDPTTGRDLHNLDERVYLIMESIEWLLNNKIKDGWDYTSIEYLRRTDIESTVPALLPTCNVIIILHNVIKSLNDLKNEHPLKIRLMNIFTDAINCLRTMQSSEGGFGRKRGDNPTIVHTAIAIKALLTDDSTESKKAVVKDLKWILKNKKIFSIDKIEVQEVFDEYDQIMFIGENKDIRRRVILHESFLEGILLNSLTEVDEKGCTNKLSFIEKYHFIKIIKIVVNELLKKQIEIGKLPGAFKSRRSAHAEQYPIYAICFAALGLQSFKKTWKAYLKKSSFMTLIPFGVFILVIALLMSWKFNLTWMAPVIVLFIEVVIGHFMESLLKQRFW